MKTAYSDIDIHFSIDDIPIRSTNIVFEELVAAIPAHSHGNGCYELHYIKDGQGRLLANGQYYDITPNTLYVTGPHVEHAQSSLAGTPMQEYCVYLQLKKPKGRVLTPLLEAFCATPFWIGQDTQDVFTLMTQLFSELSHHGIGYQNQVKLLLSQLVVYMVRNYQAATSAAFATPAAFSAPAASDACCSPDASAHCQTPAQEARGYRSIIHKSIIIEKYFLFEYRSLSLNELAKRLSLSPRQTQRLLMTYYNKSFQEKKAEARMSAAAILLGDKKRTITSIAEALGYSSLEHFSTAFRKYYGANPRDYRKTMINSTHTTPF